MTVGYPKLPKGPSAKGAAEVRNLQSQGGEFQVTRRVGVESRLSDDFSRVKTRPGGYITHGYPDGKKQKTYASATNEPPCVAMIPWLPAKREVIDAWNLGDGLYLAADTRAYTQNDRIEYTYPYTYEAIDFTVSFTLAAYVFKREVSIYRLTYYGQATKEVVATVENTIPEYTGVGFPIFPVFAPWVTYAGMSSIPGVDGETPATFFACPVLSGRLDAAGRPRNDVSINVVLPSGGVKKTVIGAQDFAGADVEFAQMMPSCATENHAAVFLRERPYWYRSSSDSPNPPKKRKFWMLRIDGKDFGSISAYDLTPSLMAGDMEELLAWDESRPVPLALFSNYSDEITAFHIRLCVLPNDVVLLSYFIMTDDNPLPPADDYLLTYNGNQFYMRIARVFLASGGGGAGVVYEEPVRSPNIFQPGTTDLILPWFPASFVRSMTHIGEGWVIATIADGLQPVKRAFVEEDLPLLMKEPGTEALRFIRSMDGGSSWSPFTPAGFDGAFELGKMGDITVHRPRAGTKPSTLLVNAWSQSAGAYFTYASKDDGLTWERKGKIAKPDEFMRMDGVWRDVGGFGVDSWGGDATFKNLLAPVGQRVADPTIPNRFEVQE